jgi:hypothetical protein
MTEQKYDLGYEVKLSIKKVDYGKG